MPAPASPDLSAPLRSALSAAAGITSQLPAYAPGFPIFSRRPAPSDAPYPLIMISPDILRSENDGINDRRPLIHRDVIVYGQNDSAEHYRLVENIAYNIYDLFHRNKASITVPSWNLHNIYCTGPVPGPTDADDIIARVVMVVVQLDALV